MKIEIGQYREMKKPGALKAFFSLCIYTNDDSDRQYTDCQYFVHGDRQWWTFAQKVVKQEDGSKPKYFSYTRYIKKSYVDELQATVLTALQNKSKESNEQSNDTLRFNQAPSSSTSQLSDNAPFSWG